MHEHFEFDGATYVSARRAAKEAGLSRDYISRLCKRGVVTARRVGAIWYVDMASVRAYLAAQEHARAFRRENLSREREQEYRTSKSEMSAAPLPVRGSGNGRSARPNAIHERMRRALEAKSGAGVAVVAGASRAPGALHAAASVPGQMLAHIPTHTITPTMDLLHRLTALVGAFTLMFSIYSVFDNTFARSVYVSASSALTAATGAIGVASDRFERGASVSVYALDAHLSDPSRILAIFEVARTETSHSLAALLRSVEDGARVALAPRAKLEPHVPEPIVSIARAEVSEVRTPPLRSASAQLAAVGALGGGSEPSVQNTPPQTGGSIATSVELTGTSVAYGDLIAYESDSGRYTVMSIAGDAHVFGVAVENPALLFAPDDSANSIAVVSSGEALVNVTLESGPITAGDPLTSSSIPGKARLATGDEPRIGTAREPFTGETGVTLVAPDGTPVRSGTIAVNVSISGGYGGGGAGEGAGSSGCTTLGCRFAGAVSPDLVRTLVKYVLSGLIAALSLTLAFRSFMSDANYGVISMGRNPRAKVSIQSMVAFNALLALAIASAGLFASMVVLFAG